jgi:hypothetical protein
MGKKLKQAGWNYGIEDIEELIKKFGANDASGIAISYYPTINAFGSMDAYEHFVNVLIQVVRKDLSRSKHILANLTMAFKFNPKESLREMNFIQFVFNLIMWRPFIVSNIPVTEKDIFNPEIFHNSKYQEYFDKFADKFRDRFTMAEFSEILFYIQIDMNKLAVNIGPLFGNSISIYDMVRMARRNAELAAIINTEIDLDNFQVAEVEAFLISQTERMFQLLLSEGDKNNPLKPFIRAGTGVNKHQVQETFIHAGFKPDLEGNTIPLTTNSNLMTNGLNTPEAVFVDSKGGRKAAIMQKGVADAGYFGRHSTFVTADITLSEDPHYSCNTVNLHSTFVANQRDLDSFIGRFMLVGEKRYKVIQKSDEHLIGTIIEVRSPVTCATKTNDICKVCYGTLYNVNYGMHAGRFASIDTNESKTQIGLSARHALATSSATVEINDERMFLLNQNGWLFHLSKTIEAKNYELVFNVSDIDMENPENYDKYDNYFTLRLIFRNIQTGEIFEVYEIKEMHLYLSKQLYQLLREKKFFNLNKGDSVTIPLKEISVDDPFVFLRISNDELTKPIKRLAKFIQKGEKPLKVIADYKEYITILNRLFRQGGMSIPSVHIEMIIRNLIRNKEDELNLPDWSIPQTPDMYKLTSMNKATILSNSVISGLMFEKVKEQLKSPRTYKKTNSSIYSLLFINE